MTHIFKNAEVPILGIGLFILLCFSLCCTSCLGGRSSGGNNSPESDDSKVEKTSAPELDSQPPMSSTKPTINIFIENSGSMNGFINRSSQFTDANQKMVTYLSNYYGEQQVKLNLINSKICPFSPNMGERTTELVTRMMLRDNFSTTGNVGTTNLNDIVKLILEKTDSESVSILISDCIYSVSDSGTSTAMLTSCANLTMDLFLEKSRAISDLSALFVMLKSPFVGKYYDYRHPNHASQNLNCKRPYYMCIIGSDSKLTELDSSIRIERLPGFEQKMKMSSVDLANSNYSVLTNFGKKGSFHYTSSGAIHTLTSATSPRDGLFSFAIGVNLSKFPLSDDEKCDLELYSIEGGGYVLDTITKVSQVPFSAPDKRLVEQNQLTHILTLHSDSGQPLKSCEIHLCKQIPEWVKNSSSVDDTRIGVDESERNKTFGIEYFVDGIYEAFARASSNEDYYMNIKVNIN